MMNGLEKGNGEKSKKGKAIMNARYNLNADKDHALKSLKYKDFIKDPLGEQAKKLEQIKLKEKKTDEFVKNIRISPEVKPPQRNDLD